MNKPRFLLAVALTLTLGGVLSAQTPAISTNGTVNAADYSRDFAPGTIISIFGTNLASTTGGPTVVPLPTTLGGTTVELVNGATVTPLPLFYISATQINTELPYGLTPGTAQIRVRTAGGVSSTDTITIVPRAPKIFSLDFSGKGSAVVTDSSFAVATQGAPVKPGDNIILWMNGLGETTPAVIAGNAAPGGSSGSTPATISDPVTVMVGGFPATVTFAGAAPGFSGLYQVNVRAPFVVVTGPLDLRVTIGNTNTQASVTVPYRQLGFYYAILGGKAVPGQTLTGLDTLAFRQTDNVAWGDQGYNQWTKPTGPASVNSAVAGEAVTLRNGTTTVFDNNGIDDGTGVSFYNNAGGGADENKPGLADLYTMSNYFPLIFSTYMKFSQTTTVGEMIGYFDPNGTLASPFDPNNPYVKYRMNIWSNAGGLPKETGGYAGDVFSTDSTPGTFTVSKTGVNRISSTVGAVPNPIWRISFKPNTPVNLAAGEYWFSHDASVRDAPAASSTSAAWVTTDELAQIIRMQPQAGEKVRFSFFGREMVYQPSWVLPFAVEVRPSAPITTTGFKAGKNDQ